MNRMENLKKFKCGLFVHFGLYSLVGKGERYLDGCKVPIDKYKTLVKDFDVPKNWTKDI